MSSVSVHIDPSRIARFLWLPGGALDRDLLRRAERVASAARQLAPGSMKQAVTAELTGRGRRRAARVLVNHHAAVFVTRGTRPHAIRPRSARALRFTKGGRIVFAARVNHPGNRPNRFLRRAMERAR